MKAIDLNHISVFFGFKNWFFLQKSNFIKTSTIHISDILNFALILKLTNRKKWQVPSFTVTKLL